MPSGSSSGTGWMWPRHRNGQPGHSGDIARNFKNESRDPDPGLFAREPVGSVPRFLAREFIQNTVDASRDERFTSVFGGVEAVEVVFRFVELTGEAKANFVAAADLRELADRAGNLDPEAAARSSQSCLHLLDDPSPLRLLYAEEFGASGMYGPWDDDLGTSKMSIAMLSGNISDKPSTAGGSFGHGKSVNAMASKVRVNIAHTCFSPVEEETEVSQRLLGVTYWPMHDADGLRYWGFGILGTHHSDGVEPTARPWVGEAAATKAAQLGFVERTHESRHLCGTSMLIVDPDVEPDELRRAVERYWWPAISDHTLLVKVVDYDGTEAHARPKQDRLLKGFEMAYRAIKTPSGQSDDTVRVRSGATVRELAKSSGRIGMTPAPTAPDDALAEKQTSLVAYIRGLGMVVKYRSLQVGPAFVNGVFVSNPDEDVERLLVKSEPKTHADWLKDPDDTDAETKHRVRLLVQNIDESVRKEVKEYSRFLTPDDPNETFTFKDLDRELNALLRKQDSQAGPTPEVRDFAIRRGRPELFPVGTHQVRVRGKVKVERRDERISACAVAIRYYLPDDKGRGRPIELAIEAPTGFNTDEDDTNLLLGPIDEDSLEFGWTTPPYDRDWIGELDVEVTPRGS